MKYRFKGIKMKLDKAFIASQQLAFKKRQNKNVSIAICTQKEYSKISKWYS